MTTMPDWPTTDPVEYNLAAARQALAKHPPAEAAELRAATWAGVETAPPLAPAEAALLEAQLLGRTSKPAIESRAGFYGIRWGEPEYLTIEFDKLRDERGEVKAEVTAWATPDGLERHLHGPVGFNLSSSRMRTDLAKTLKTRSRGHQPDFDTAVEDACNGALRAYRAGTPSLRLRDAVRPEGAGLILPPLTLGTMPTSLYGDGGNAKSLIGLAIAETIQTGAPILGLAPTATGNVGYCDWEMDAWTHRERALALTGQESDVRYIACARPLTDDIDRIRAEVRKHSLIYLIIDSVALACDGPPEAAEVANRFFVALRSLELGSLLIAHTTKGENADAKPFGSAFWHNGSRLTWLVKRQAEIGETLRIGLFNKKANTGPIAAPLGFDITWGERITIGRTDVRDIPNLAEHVSLKYRIGHELDAGARTIADVAVALDSPIDSVKKALERGAKAGDFVRVTGSDGITRWGRSQ